MHQNTDTSVKLPLMGEVLQNGMQGPFSAVLPKPCTPTVSQVVSKPNVVTSAPTSKNRLITDYLQQVPAFLGSTSGPHVASSDRDKSDWQTPGARNFGPDETAPSLSVTCKSCGCPFPPESSEAPKLHGVIWECGTCQDSKREMLITELKEKARLKALEREKRELISRQQKEEARLKREQEMQQRREMKE